MPKGVQIAFLDPAFGATSTMVGWLMLENGIIPDARVATALTYGIKTDTMELARGAGPLDEQVYRDVYSFADKRILARIQRARLSQDYFRVLERGLRRAKVTDFTPLRPISGRSTTPTPSPRSPTSSSASRACGGPWWQATTGR